MNTKELLNFSNSLTNLSLNELCVKRNELIKDLVKMINNPELIEKLEILEQKIEEKSNGSSK